MRRFMLLSTHKESEVRMCKKCNDTGTIITSYKDGHEDVDLCDCEYNPYTQLRTIKTKNKRLREALEKIKALFDDNYPQYDCCMKKDSIHYFQCDKDNTCRYSKDACFYYLAKQALGE